MPVNELVLRELYELERLAQRSLRRGDQAEAQIYRDYIEFVRQEFVSEELNEIYEAASVVRDYIRLERGEADSVSQAVTKLAEFVGDFDSPLLAFDVYKLGQAKKLTAVTTRKRPPTLRKKGKVQSRGKPRAMNLGSYGWTSVTRPARSAKSTGDLMVFQVRRGSSVHRISSGLHRVDDPKAKLVQTLLDIA